MVSQPDSTMSKQLFSRKAARTAPPIATTTMTATATIMIMAMAHTTMRNVLHSVQPLALLRLHAWLSPAFPIGSYSYSHGLEWAVEAGSVHDRTSLVDWLAA